MMHLFEHEPRERGGVLLVNYHYSSVPAFFPFSEKFLTNCFYVVIPELPNPYFPELRDAGFGSFIDDDHAGITYKNCYFVKAEQEAHSLNPASDGV
jgi:hypothetical protein